MIPRLVDPSAPLRDTRRSAVVAAIFERDDSAPVLDPLREITSAQVPSQNTPQNGLDVDTVIDDQGTHGSHVDANLARHDIVEILMSHGADIHRDQQTFNTLVSTLHPSIRTLDTSRKPVVHHVVSVAGVSRGAISARYYLEQIFVWIAIKGATSNRLWIYKMSMVIPH
ncbi:hypothetical protein H2248_007052 [Termitomyces sp. 'cryptogamus']|nr:hypothetical protein H2248_007052 [Termitomyces sp. 'cryptogamus']